MADQIITVDFRDDTLFAVDRGNGDVFIAIAPICRSFGIDPATQRKRIQDDPVLSKGSGVIPLPSPSGSQETVMLRLDLLNGWLFGINANRVRADKRAALIAYQYECHRVLFDHFFYRTRHETPELAATRANATALNAASRAVGEIRRSLGARAAAASLPNLFAKAGITIAAAYHRPPQEEMDLSEPSAIEEDSNVIDIRANEDPAG